MSYPDYSNIQQIRSHDNMQSVLSGTESGLYKMLSSDTMEPNYAKTRDFSGTGDAETSNIWADDPNECSMTTTCSSQNQNNVTHQSSANTQSYQASLADIISVKGLTCDVQNGPLCQSMSISQLQSPLSMGGTVKQSAQASPINFKPGLSSHLQSPISHNGIGERPERVSSMSPLDQDAGIIHESQDQFHRQSQILKKSSNISTEFPQSGCASPQRMNSQLYLSNMPDDLVQTGSPVPPGYYDAESIRRSESMRRSELSYTNATIRSEEKGKLRKKKRSIANNFSSEMRGHTTSHARYQRIENKNMCDARKFAVIFAQEMLGQEMSSGSTKPPNNNSSIVSELIQQLNERNDFLQQLSTVCEQVLEKSIGQEKTIKDLNRRWQRAEHNLKIATQELSLQRSLQPMQSDWSLKALDVLLVGQPSLPNHTKGWLEQAKIDPSAGEEFVAQLKEWKESGTLNMGTQRENMLEQEEKEVVQLRNQVRLLKDKLQEQGGTIRVFCRLKPESSRCIKVTNSLNTSIEITAPQVCGNRPTSFVFDRVFGPLAKQEDVYSEVQDVIENLSIGTFYGLIMAYGQTGSGKTYTLDGNEQNPGLQRTAMKRIMDSLGNDPKVKFELSAIEIYNESVRDLFHKPTVNLEVRQAPEKSTGLFGGMHVPGMVTKSVKNWEDIRSLLEFVKSIRAQAATALNDFSSRSHTIISLGVTRSSRFSAIHFVDLAGSERTKVSQAEGTRMIEANAINRSLSALGDTLLALEQKKSHIPFRNSKLSFLLSDVLVKRWSKVLMIATCASDPVNAHETFSTLSFANKMQNIKKR